MKYEGSYFYFGPPGTGKTRTLKNQVQAIVENGSNPLLVSMTRTAAAELASRVRAIPPEQIGTLHAMAYRQLDQPQIAEVHAKEFNEWIGNPQMGIRPQGGNLDEPDQEFPQCSSGGEECYSRYALYRNAMTARRRWPALVQLWAEKWRQWKRETGYLDFTDLIERCITRDVPPPPGINVIIADECQDLSKLEYHLLKMWGCKAGAMMMAGDPYQSLYTWRGASPENFFDPDVPDSRRKVLSKSYRLPRAIHERAVRLISRLSKYRPIEYQPRPEDGAFTVINCGYKYPMLAINMAQEKLAQGNTVMFATTCRYMTAPLIAYLRRVGTPYANPWRLNRGEWNPLSAGRGAPISNRIMALLKADPSMGKHSRLWTAGEFNQWSSLMGKGLLAKGGTGRLKYLMQNQPNHVLDIDEYYDILNPVGQDLLMELQGLLGKRAANQDTVPVSTVLNWWRENLEAAPRHRAAYALDLVLQHGINVLAQPPKCYVGTVHSFKGGEADVVFLFTDLSPQGQRSLLNGGQDDLLRLFYVGMTRARQELIVCNSSLSLSFNLLRYV